MPAAARGGLPGVFLDRDGTLNANPPYGSYVTRWEAFRMLPGVVAALAALRAAGVKTALATNQACVGKGLATEEQVAALHARMQRELAARAAALDLVQFCPHREQDGCECRKPRAGLIDRGAEVLGLDRSRCVMVGDSSRDIAAGKAANIATVLLTAETYEADRERALASGADLVCEDLPGALAWILARVGVGVEHRR